MLEEITHGSSTLQVHLCFCDMPVAHNDRSPTSVSHMQHRHIWVCPITFCLAHHCPVGHIWKQRPYKQNRRWSSDGSVAAGNRNIESAFFTCRKIPPRGNNSLLQGTEMTWCEWVEGIGNNTKSTEHSLKPTVQTVDFQPESTVLKNYWRWAKLKQPVLSRPQGNTLTCYYEASCTHHSRKNQHATSGLSFCKRTAVRRRAWIYSEDNHSFYLSV